jgi:phosphatidate cytidylyltransferase
MQSKLDDHTKRWRGGLLIAFLGFSTVTIGNIYYLFFVCFLLWLACKELLNLIKASKANPPSLLLQFLCPSASVVAYFAPSFLPIWLTVSSLLILTILVLRAFYGPKIQGTISDVAVSFLCLVYIGWLPSYMILVRQIGFSSGVGLFEQAGLFYALFALVSIVFNDMGAYYAGKAFGKTKLAQSISPNKTIKGSVGGIIIGSLTGILLSIYLAPLFHLKFNLLCVSVAAIAFNIIAQLGDLVESLIKRSVGVKDAGQTIEGHGGVLDRFDSHIFAHILAYYFFYYHHLGLFN